MLDAREFINSVTQRIFSNWTALKMAVEYGMGTKEGAQAFGSHIADIIYLNEGLSIGDVAFEIEDYMDDQFNTALEDGSQTQVAAELLRIYRYCLENNEQLALEELEKLPPMQSWIVSKKSTIKPQLPDSTMNDSSSEDDDEENKTSIVAKDDGWVTVGSRK